MANVCENCGKKIGVFSDTPFELENGSLLCFECGSYIEKIIEKLQKAKTKTEFDLLKESIVKELNQKYNENIYLHILSLIERLREKFIADKTEEVLPEVIASIILTTGSVLEGYKIEQYIDVICEECIFKNSGREQLMAGLKDLANVFSSKEKEMTGANQLISNGRKYVLRKFRERAADMGANAVIGVEFESSFGSDLVRIAIFGTAVKVKKIEQDVLTETHVDNDIK